MAVMGCDISNHQLMLPDISPYGFVFHKCTEGDSYADVLYSARHDVVRAQNKVWGAYLFMRMDSSAQAQVDFFTAHADIQPGDVIILDFENDGTWPNYPDAVIAQRARECMALLTAQYPFNRVLLYSNTSTFRSIVQGYNVPVGDGLWDADYNATPPGTPWLFWQYSDNPFDQDQETRFPTLAVLQVWAHGKEVSDMAGFIPFTIDQVKGRAYAAFEVGSNSQIVKDVWIAAKALWGGITVNVVFTDDNGNGLPSPGLQTITTNQRLYWKAPDGASDVTLEWTPGQTGTLAPYAVWR